MGAKAAPFPGRDPDWNPRRNRAALTFTVGLHVLAVVWLQQRRPLPAPAEARRVVSILLQLPASRARATHVPVPAPVPVRLHARATPRLPGPAASGARAALPPAPGSAAAPAPTPSSPSAQDALAPPPVPVDAASLARDPAIAAHGSFALGIAKRQAGRIDRELRGGKSGVPLEADTPWARFQRALEAAHIERSMSMIEDSYTSPDGVVIYRRRIGGHSTCYRTGGVGLGVAGTRGSNDAGRTECPKGVTWQRLE